MDDDENKRILMMMMVGNKKLLLKREVGDWYNWVGCEEKRRGREMRLSLELKGFVSERMR
jgi:hypothetical protein